MRFGSVALLALSSISPQARAQPALSAVASVSGGLTAGCLDPPQPKLQPASQCEIHYVIFGNSFEGGAQARATFGTLAATASGSNAESPNIGEHFIEGDAEFDDVLHFDCTGCSGLIQFLFAVDGFLDVTGKKSDAGAFANLTVAGNGSVQHFPIGVGPADNVRALKAASLDSSSPSPFASPIFSFDAAGDFSLQVHLKAQGTLSCASSACTLNAGGAESAFNAILTGIRLFDASGNPVPPANFTITSGSGTQYPLAPTCARNIDSSVSVTPLGYIYNFATHRFNQTVTMTNISGAAISGPIALVLDNLSSKATLFHASGTTSCAAPAGSPFVKLGSLAKGAGVSLVLQFTDPTLGAITYNARVLGAGIK